MFNLTGIYELQDYLARDSVAFLPELILCVGIVLLLLLRLFRAFNRLHLGWVGLGVAAAALVTALGQWQGWFGLDKPSDYAPPNRIDLFSGLLVYDTFTIYLRLFLIFFAGLIVWLTLLTGIPDREDSADFYCLLFGATLGMCLMASANHLLMVFIAVEMASLPSYALAGFLKGKRQSSEASLKYVVYGGGASGVMLYGISLLAGKFGTASLPVLAQHYIAALQPGAAMDPVLVLGTLFLIVGVAFKLAAVPFHFWCPDVFEGASAEVAGFLSVASKGAALALLARVVFTLTGLDRAVIATDSMSVARYLLPTLAIFAAVTATFGNLAAYLQTNLKRLLAYSTIAHAGYMMMGLAALTRDGAAAVLFYLIAYLFMNLGAFAVVAFLRNQTGSEDLSSFRGLVRRAPVLTVTLAVFLLSLLGMPPLAGFAAKFQIFRVLYEGGQYYATTPYPGLGYWLYALLVIGGLNTVLSVFYYIKVIKVMILETTLEEVEGRPSSPLPAPGGALLYASLVAAVLFVAGILWDPLARWSDQGADKNRFHDTPPRKTVAHAVTEVRPVIDPHDAALLESAIRREGRSLLQYVSEAFPWTKSSGDPTPDTVRTLAREERDAVGTLAKLLARRRHTVPYLGAYPMAFTTMNFVALEYLLPRLAEDGRRAIDALQRDRAALTDAEARAAIDRFLDMKRRHLKALEALATAPAAAAH